ncbi:cellulose binding domain-containing protein [Streptomyces californicus]
MTYDFFGAWAAQRPDGPALAADLVRRHPAAGLHLRRRHREAQGPGRPGQEAPPRHRLLRPRLDRRHPGRPPAAPATGPAPGTYEAGIEDYKVLKNSCPATGTIAGTAYAHCGNNWWSYDTPATVGTKMAWAKSQGLGGAFFWEFNGDTTNGELVTAISGLK